MIAATLLFGAVAHAAQPGLTLAPYGAVSALAPQDGTPAFQFHSEDPVLNITRIQKTKMPTLAACEKAVRALQNLPLGSVFSGGSVRAFKDWGPWNEDDRDAAEGCDDFPCKVKLDANEVARMKKSPPPSRIETLASLAQARAARYLKTGIRAEYEFPGAPTDPWKWFDDNGFKTLTRPAAPVLRARKLDLVPGKMRPLRQILDCRYAFVKKAVPKGAAAKGGAKTNGDGIEAALWIRDVYTAHYFDSWGEWYGVSCDPKTLMLVTVASLHAEFDLLKKNDLISRISRPKMRGAIKENGSHYLEGQMKTLNIPSK
ncbi:MAG: hypothetical protein HYW49_04840 [Deltaproteobacteria bacterium]|nr:hypothetical protein [Deltaproteobacteria bacterium]